MEDVALTIRDRIQGGHPVRHDELRAEPGIDVPLAGRDAPDRLDQVAVGRVAPPSCSADSRRRRQRSPTKEAIVSTTHTPDRFTTLPDEQTLAATVVALEEHGFSVEVVDDLDAAREAVLARIPEGSSVMTNTSVTLQETGIADAIDDGGPYESARNKMFALDFATQAAGDEGDRRPARLRPRQRPRGHPRRNAGHRLGLRQPARLLRLGRRQRHLRRRRAEARPDPGGRPRADLSSTA